MKLLYADPRQRRPCFEYPGTAGAGPRQTLSRQDRKCHDGVFSQKLGSLHWNIPSPASSFRGLSPQRAFLFLNLGCDFMESGWSVFPYLSWDRLHRDISSGDILGHYFLLLAVNFLIINSSTSLQVCFPPSNGFPNPLRLKFSPALLDSVSFI